MKFERRTIEWSRRTTSCSATTAEAARTTCTASTATKLTGAVDQLYSEMAGRHRARPRSIQIIRTGVVENKGGPEAPGDDPVRQERPQIPAAAPHRARAREEVQEHVRGEPAVDALPRDVDRKSTGAFRRSIDTFWLV